MILRFVFAALVSSSLLVVPLNAQARPDLAGTWILASSSDPGVSVGRLGFSVEATPESITVTDQLFDESQTFVRTLFQAVYGMDGKAGALATAGRSSRWVGDQLVLTSRQDGSEVMQVLLLQGAELRSTRVAVRANRAEPDVVRQVFRKGR